MGIGNKNFEENKLEATEISLMLTNPEDDTHYNTLPNIGEREDSLDDLK